MTLRQSHTLCWGRRRLDLGRRTCIMGILNATPDSFSDGGRFLGIDAAVARAEALVAAGADILDIGGESTRPFSDPVPEEEELRRVLPVIERLVGRIPVPISIDTMKADVARRALETGAEIINDVSALRMDSQMAAVAAEHGAPLIVMHMLGTPKTMQKDPVYDDLLGQVGRFLGKAAETAVAAGVDRSRVIIDPGIGFGKTVLHNLTLIRRLNVLAELGFPLLVGPSRKAFVRCLLRQEGRDEPLPDSPQVETGTQAAVTAAILNGAHIIRVHNVADTVATARIADALLETEMADPPRDA